MPRLTDDRIKAGILHADVNVRHAAMLHFADCPVPNPTVMPAVIEALGRFGRDKAFRLTHPIERLTQTDSTVHWAVQELKTRPHTTEEDLDYLHTVSRLLCNADPQLVRPYEADILASSTFDRHYVGELTYRLKVMTWDEGALWRELEAICEAGKGESYVDDIRWDEATSVVLALARQGDRHAGRMMSVLRQKVEGYENNPLKWMEPLMVRLAGELRHEPALPTLVAKLHEDADLLNEECQTALARIGGDDVIRAVQRDYPTSEWHFRLFAAGVLRQIHTDGSVLAGTELLSEEEDGEFQTFLAEGLVQHFSTEGNEAVREWLLRAPPGSAPHVQDDLVAACTLMGQDFPELEAWRKEKEAREAEEEKRRRSFLLGGDTPRLTPADFPDRALLQAPPVHREVPIRKDEKKVGRNDPCPCGSGKKFKKCCIHKADLI